MSRIVWIFYSLTPSHRFLGRLLFRIKCENIFRMLLAKLRLRKYLIIRIMTTKGTMKHYKIYDVSRDEINYIRCSNLEELFRKKKELMCLI